jgi:polyhydroxyalkanoate synthesis repressor PhaR
MADTVLIKKYSNRRLYDTEKSRYISLNDLTEMIREGRYVKVMETNTKEDVTAFILTQIILEEAKKKNALLPVPLLSLIIQYGENVLAEFFEKYLLQIVKMYIRYRKAFDHQFKNWLDLGLDLSSTSFFDFFSNPADTTKSVKNEKERN